MHSEKQHGASRPYGLACFGFSSAFVLLTLWFNIIGYTSVFSDSANFARPAFIGAILATTALCAALGNRIEKRLATFDLIALFCMTLGGVAVLAREAIAFSYPQADIAVAAYALMGVSYSYSSARLYFAAAKCLTTNGIAIVSVALALAYPLFGALSTLGYGVLVAAVLLVAPLAVFVALSGAKSPRLGVEEGGGSSVLPRQQSALFVAVILISLPIVALRSSGLVGLWGSAPHTTQGFGSIWSVLVLAAVSIVVLAGAMHFISRSKRWGAVSALYLVLVILLAVSQFINSTGQTAFAPFANSLITICYCSVYSFAILLFVRTAKRYAFNACALFILMIMVMMALWIPLIAITSLAVSFALLVSIVLLIVGLWQNTQKRHLLSPGLGDDIADSACAEFGLTKREREVFGYLSQGHSVPYIQKKLLLAESTVRMHVTHIYQKLDVTSRSEFLDKINADENRGRL